VYQWDRRVLLRLKPAEVGVAALELAALFDRLLHRSVVITLDGASYRLRNHTAASDELRRVTTGTNLR